MDNSFSEQVNSKRRANLTKYTLLAILVYHVPIAVAFLAIFLGFAQYRYSEMLLTYLGLFPSNIVILVMIRHRTRITLPFIQAMLYSQVIICVIFMAIIFHVMHDLRYLALMSSLIPLIFVFTQANMLISHALIIVSVSVYITVSFVSYRYLGQSTRFGEDCLAALTFLPTASFVAFMCWLLQKQRREIKASRDKIKTTFDDLEVTHKELERYHNRMLENLHYAKIIQRSLLPGVERLKTELPESLIIWMPKDIVGGDIFYTYTLKDITIIALMDCTGHGVSGAFITLIAFTEIKKIILDQQCFDPPEILDRLNTAVKSVLHQDASRQTQDGLDAAVLHVDHSSCVLRFSGARIPLFYTQDGQTAEIKGDKRSIGYADSEDHVPFTSNTVQLYRDTCVYMKTDGYTDQIGGDNEMRFGTATFKGMLSRLHPFPFSVQRQEIIKKFNEHKQEREQLDDVTVIGFRM